MGKLASKRAYGDCEGPFGFPMASDVAKVIEEVWKGVSAECKEVGFKRTLVLPAGMELKEAERADISFVTTDAVDRDFELMDPKGADWKQFLKNPVVTFAHQYDQLPVGRSLWVKRWSDKGHDGWLAKTRYTERPPAWTSDWIPDAVWHFIKSGDLPGKSIGFIPTEVRPPETKEIEQRPELAKVRRIISKFLVLEYAIAPVQSNPEALVVSVAKAKTAGLAVGGILETLGMLIPSEVPEIKIEVEPEPEPEPKIVAAKAVVLQEMTPGSAAVLMRREMSKMLKDFNPTQVVRDELRRLAGKVD
jgi:hypothetical protein